MVEYSGGDLFEYVALAAQKKMDIKNVPMKTNEEYNKIPK